MLQEEEEEEDSVVTCETSDGITFNVQFKMIIQSETLKNLVEDVGINYTIPIPNVNSKSFKKILEYLSHPRETSWDANFTAQMPQDDLFELLLATNFLDIKSLMNLLCSAAASSMNNKSVEELREMFGMENDFTEAEERENAEANKWVEEMYTADAAVAAAAVAVSQQQQQSPPIVVVAAAAQQQQSPSIDAEEPYVDPEE
jgi:S-phase kinase-associated protein 1